MPSLSNLVAVFPLIVVGAVGDGVGYDGIPKSYTGSSGQALGRESRSRWFSKSDTDTNTVPLGTNNVPLGTFYPEQDGLAEGTQDDWNLEQIPTETAPTQPPGFSGSDNIAVSRATSYFAINDKAENVRDNQHAVLGRMDGLLHHRQGQHRVPLQNIDNVQYIGDMMIGEPPQRLKVGDFDVYSIRLL